MDSILCCIHSIPIAIQIYIGGLGLKYVTRYTHHSESHPVYRQRCLPKSKIDQFKNGHTIPLAPSGDAACPVISLRTLFTLFSKPDSDPLFSCTLGPFNKCWLAENLSTALL